MWCLVPTPRGTGVPVKMAWRSHHVARRRLDRAAGVVDGVLVVLLRDVFTVIIETSVVVVIDDLFRGSQMIT